MRRSAQEQPSPDRAPDIGQTEAEIRALILDITHRLLYAIHTGDADTYARYSAPELTCFEELAPCRIDGLDFHLTMIAEMAKNPDLAPARFDIVMPHIQLYGDTAIITYTRLMSYFDEGIPRTTTANETRVFIRQEDTWRMVHFHRSPTR